MDPNEEPDSKSGSLAHAQGQRSGHSPTLEEPQETADAILSFIDSL